MAGLATPPDAIPAKPVKPTAAPGTPYVLAPHYMDRIKKFEGFTARPKWDAKQYSWGYGTRALGPTGSITPEQADADFGREIGEAHGIVHSFAPNAPEHVKAALTSLTYNSGGGWTKGAIGQAIARGDYAAAAGLMPRYKVTSAGKFLPGLATRRAEEASWMTGAPTSPITAPTANPASGAAPMALGMTQPPSQDQVNLFAKRGMAMMPDWNRPIGHWTQALGNLAQQISGSMWLDKAEKAMGERRDAETASWGGMAGAMVPGLSRPPTSSGATSAAASGFGPQGMTSPPPINNSALAPQKPKAAPEAQPAITGGQTATQAPAMLPQDDGRPAIGQAPQPVTTSSAPVTTSTLPDGAGPGVLSGLSEAAAPVAQRSPLTPVSTQPQAAPADTRVNEIDQQIDAINGQVRALAPYLQNEATRAQAWQAIQQLEQRRTHYEDMRIARSDPSEVMKRRQMELDIASKERDLASPQKKVTVIPEGASLGIEDTRAGSFQMLHQGQPKVDATTKKAIDEADDFVAQTHAAVGALNEAVRLNTSAYDGWAASGRASIANNLAPWPTPDAKATTELENVVTQQALQSLRATFGGNPTEGERKILLEVAGSVNQPREVRADIYKRALSLANQRLEINRQKAAALRSGSYYQAGGQPQAVDQPVNLHPHQSTIDEARAAIRAGAPRDKVIERLRKMGISESGI